MTLHESHELAEEYARGVDNERQRIAEAVIPIIDAVLTDHDRGDSTGRWYAVHAPKLKRAKAIINPEEQT